jgi:hypothetical protein
MSLLLLPFRLLSRLTSWLGAWFVALGSVVGLVALLREYDAAGTAQSLLHAGDSVQELLPLGLAYQGGTGFGLALAQATGVLMAFLLSLSRHTGRRRMGRLTLVLWAGWATLGALTLASENVVMFGGQAGLCIMLLLASLNRMVAGWPQRPPRRRWCKVFYCGTRVEEPAVDVVDVSDLPTDVTPAACPAC